LTFVLRPQDLGCLVIAEFASYLWAMKTLLLFIGTVLRSRILQRKGLGAVPAVYKLILYWWMWTPPQPDVQSEAPRGLNTKSSHEASLLLNGPNP
jgi:hypothetical protein